MTGGAATLRRELGLVGATMMGLGSIVGTGIFVSVGVAAGAAARLDAGGTTPWVAVLLTGGLIAGLTAIGDVETTWSFSAFTVLVYYALTNLAALRLTDEQRLFSRFHPRVGLAGCLFLAFWVDPAVWGTGLGLIGGGLVWHRLRRRSRSPR